LGFVPEIELERFVPAHHPALKDSKHPKYNARIDPALTVFGRPLSDWITDLNGIEKVRRYRAIATIGLAGTSVSPILVAALNDPDVCVAYWAAIGLGNTHDSTPGTVDALFHAQEHTSISVRLASARALTILGKSELALPIALKALDDADIFVRLAASQIIERIAPKTETIREALRVAKDDKRDPRDYVADVARHALGLPAQH
jgi:HEAT repeat protein